MRPSTTSPRWTRNLVLAVIATLASVPPPARSQETIEGGISETGLRRVPIAVPLFTTPAGSDARSMAQEVTETLRADLGASGYFTVVPPDYYRLLPEGERSGVDYQGWAGLGAESLTLGSVTPDGGRFQVEARLFDPQDEQMIMGRRYRGEPDLARQIAHRFADEIVLHYTGHRGMSQSKVAFAARVGEAKEIFLMDYDGRRVRRLTANGSLNLSPAWAPDGKQIVLTSYKDGFPVLYFLNQEGTIRKMRLPGASLNISPDWSPDGRTIAYSASRKGNADIYLLDVESASTRRLTSQRAIECCPSWSPTGREIAFTSDRGGTPQIYVMDAEGANVRRLTYEGSYNESAAWSPVGDRIAYVSRISSRFHLNVMDLATRKVSQLTQGRSNNESPDWSPDGRHLLFASDRSGNYDIYRVPLGGGKPVRLTRTQGATSPTWSE